MRKRFKVALLVATVLGPVAAAAETRQKTLFQHKNWAVKLIAHDDGRFACLAKVDDGAGSLNLWLAADKSVRLQFFSPAWKFGEGDTGDLRAQIGSRAPWNLNGAQLYKNSVIFDLPDTKASVAFLTEVAQGNQLELRTPMGKPMMTASLAGSKAAMAALGECAATPP